MVKWLNMEDKTKEEKLHTEESDYFFIQEKIKDRPLDKKKLLKRMLTTAGLAIVFGVVACLTIICLEPMFKKAIGSGESIEVEQIVLQESDDVDNVDDISVSIVDTPFEETPIEDLNLYDDSASDNDVNIEALIIDYEIELDDYQLLYRKLYQLSEEMQKSLVTVTAVTSDVDIFDAGLMSTNRTTGLILGDNGYELLIFADGRNINPKGEIKVTFCDGTIHNAELKNSDEDTGLAIYSVKLEDISLETMEKITEATLGNSYSAILPGTAIIAVGNPMGTNTSVCYGAVTSTDMFVSKRDINYQILTTDIYGSRNAYGFIVNVRGQVLGIITPDNHSDDMGNLIYAYGISSVKRLAEDLSNGVEKGYLGLYVADISQDQIGVSNVPPGAYVVRTAPDSPGMNVGIISGDIITSIDSTYIGSVADYDTALRSIEHGKEVEIKLFRPSGGEYREITVTVVIN